MISLVEAAGNIQAFEGDSLANRLSALEDRFQGINGADTESLCSTFNIDRSLLNSALVLKQVAGQINVVIHSVGILVSLPHILEGNETVESLSLGAGNTGKPFDLETSLRVAEFKFIQWKGGAESIRQNSLFKDFYWLAEYDTTKRRYLYVLGLKHPLSFLSGGRALDSVMSRNNKLRTDFQRRYGKRFSKVCEYYEYHKSRVELVDITKVAPPLADIFG
jgi:hypothetical protein